MKYNFLNPYSARECKPARALGPAPSTTAFAADRTEDGAKAWDCACSLHWSSNRTRTVPLPFPLRFRRQDLSRILAAWTIDPAAGACFALATTAVSSDSPSITSA